MPLLLLILAAFLASAGDVAMTSGGLQVTDADVIFNGSSSPQGFFWDESEGKVDELLVYSEDVQREGFKKQVSHFSNIFDVIVRWC